MVYGAFMGMQCGGKLGRFRISSSVYIGKTYMDFKAIIKLAFTYET